MHEIKDALLQQKRELEARLKEDYVEREGNLKLNQPLIKVIIGPRRAGKSFFALHFLKNNFGYVNFDDERLATLTNYDELITTLNSLYSHPKEVLFDEIQNLGKWELFVNRLQRQGFNLILTGSNSHLLSQELATHLTGRHLLILIFPFSFKEYLRLEKKEHTSTEIREKLSQYLIDGGYPEPCVKNLDRREYISSLFNAIVYKDIVKRYKIRNSSEIENLAFYLISNVAQEYSYRSLTKNCGIKSSHTIEKYMGYLEEAFVFFTLNKFAYKVREQLSSNKKIYCIDNSFIQAKAFQVRPDWGKLYENLVAIELKKGELQNHFQIYYWKNQLGEEVDFVVKEGAKVTQLIQVCFNLQNLETRNREIRALVKAIHELRCTKAIVITENQEGEEEVEWFGLKGRIKFVPLWRWLLLSPTGL
ncbi:ATP-binding protein [Candidatus Woesearchaeota archaeon]|nr:ATP-binding protein [Candidatus Woesearchaeota archaeon]